MAKIPADEPDIFVANKCYPDAMGLFFNGYQTLDQVRNTCVVILDTNALLVPYGISKSGVSEIASTYKQLVASNRLVVPGQVAREFAKNRPSKIGEIFQAVSRKQNLKSPDSGRYPLLQDVPSYQKLQELEGKITTLIGEYRGAIGDLLGHIQKWYWNDPVSALYSELFPKVIVDPSIDEESIRSKMDYLHTNKMPPGYKDGAKLDHGVGDVLVWQAVVHVAEERKRPVVLVSGDNKADWFYRFELVDEIRRVSDGKSLHIVSFSSFLELFGATAEAVGEVRSEEINIDLSTMSPFGRNSVLAHVAEQAVADWLRHRHPELDVRRDDRSGAFALAESGGAVIRLSVKYYPKSRRHKPMVYSRLRLALDQFKQRYDDSGYDNILVFLVFESADDADDAAIRLPDILTRCGHPEASVVVAHLPKDGLLRVHDPLKALPEFE
jgi:hypothetical protein